MKRIKWENIGFIIMLVYGVAAIMHHSQNQFTYTEIPVYFGLALVVRYAIKYIRLNPEEVKNKIKNIIKED